MKLVTVSQAAEELGVQPVRVRQLCQQGRIKGAEKLGWAWVIPQPIKIIPGTRGPKMVKVRVKSEQGQKRASNKEIHADCKGVIHQIWSCSKIRLVCKRGPVDIKPCSG